MGTTWTEPLRTRFAAKATWQPDGCWHWTGAKNSQGYGMLRADGRAQYAHRLSYEALIGPIPPGLHIDHLCRVRHCVNPIHLEPVTKRENERRGLVARALVTHCGRGHEYAVVGRYETTNICRACVRENNAATPKGAGTRLRARCLHGHAYDDRTTLVTPGGRRACKVCRGIADAGATASECLLAVILSAVIVTCLTIAFILGENLRCDRLLDDSTVSAQRIAEVCGGERLGSRSWS